MYSLSATSFVDANGQLLFDVTFKEDDTILEKRISVEDFVELLTVSEKECESQLEEVEIYPPEIKGAFKGKPGNFKTLMVFPAKKRGVSYMGKIYYVPFPALVMKVSYLNKGRQYAKMFALDTDCPNKDSKIYTYPFGNVSCSGEICFGNIDVRVDGIKDCPKLFEAFINGVTNNDYFDKQNNKVGYKQGALLDALEELESYPVEWLVEYDRYGKTTYGDFIEK